MWKWFKWFSFNERNYINAHQSLNLVDNYISNLKIPIGMDLILVRIDWVNWRIKKITTAPNVYTIRLIHSKGINSNIVLKHTHTNIHVYHGVNRRRRESRFFPSFCFSIWKSLLSLIWLSLSLLCVTAYKTICVYSYNFLRFSECLYTPLLLLPLFTYTHKYTNKVRERMKWINGELKCMLHVRQCGITK